MDGGSGISYSNKMILAPMVRAGRLPLRLLALRYGADLVYSEEHIDRKILKCRRIENPILGTVDFISPDGQCQFRTCQLEKERVVFQMGTADPENALKTAKMVEEDVAGIDVNMGCPKEFSIKGGMGAALLTDPDRVHAILTTLVQGVKKPVTCKIRLLPSSADTLQLVKVIERTGVAAVAVHGRYRHERPKEACHDALIKEVAQSLSIPVIANGGSLDISEYKDILKFRERTGCSSVMVARAALSNPSIFRKEGLLPIKEVAHEFVKLCILMDERIGLSKYCLSVMLKEFAKIGCPDARALSSASANNLKELSNVHDLSSYYDSLQTERELLIDELPVQKQKELNVGIFSPFTSKRCRLDVREEAGVYELHVQYDERNYSSQYGERKTTPKAMILEYASHQKLPKPAFTLLEEENRLYRAIVTLGQWKYTSTIWSTSKKKAEQSAALVALTHHGVLTPL